MIILRTFLLIVIFTMSVNCAESMCAKIAKFGYAYNQWIITFNTRKPDTLSLNEVTLWKQVEKRWKVVNAEMKREYGL